MKSVTEARIDEQQKDEFKLNQVVQTTIFPFNTSAVLVSMDRGPLPHRDVVSFGLVTMAL